MEQGFCLRRSNARASAAAAAAVAAAATAAAITATTTTTAINPVATVDTTASSNYSYTNTAKLPIEIVKRLIAAVHRRPNLWLRNSVGGQKRCDITPLWHEVSQDVNLPVDICRIKWGHLRDNFRKVYIRNNLTDATPTTWRFYNDMRFMEKSVAENIIQQSRSNRKPTYWHSLNGNILIKTPPSDASVPICELSEGFDRDIHQPSFSDITSFFEDTQHMPLGKRIKLDGKMTKFEPDISNDYTIPDAHSTINEEPNDDDFDEDAATDENDTDQLNTQEKIKSSTVNNDGIFTIEVLDDDDEDQEKQHTQHFKNQSFNLDDQKNGPFKNITVEAATNTELCNGEAVDEDADRMFLLSLLPFMQKMDERRKLHIRQKLQSVLIEEFG